MLFAALLGVRAAAAEPQSWELTPYRVHLTIKFEGTTKLSPAFEQAFREDVTARLKSAVGGAWNLTVEPEGGDHAHAAAGKAKSPDQKSPAKAAAAEPSAFRGGDKVLGLKVGRTQSGFLLQASELDELTELANAPVARECANADALAREATSALLATFAPLARIEAVQGNTVRLRLKAAKLYPRDTAQALAAPGTAFRPVLMKSDSQGNLAKGSTEVIPWTFLVPTGMVGGQGSQRIACNVVTGLDGAAIPDYHPHRQRLALGASRSSAMTRLKIVTDDGQNTPQEGYEVLEESTASDGQGVTTARIGASGTDGVVEIPPGSAAVRMLVVRHGDIVLARLPLVPGLVGELTLALPPAGQRVAIAAALASLEDDLIDRLALQQVFNQRIEAATAAGDTAVADKLRGELGKLPAKDAFAARLAEQEQALAKADATAQRLLSPRVAAVKKVFETLSP
jgi:hypothetical protein